LHIEGELMKSRKQRRRVTTPGLVVGLTLTTTTSQAAGR
jgi:hypothetical protein